LSYQLRVNSGAASGLEATFAVETGRAGAGRERAAVTLPCAGNPGLEFQVNGGDSPG